MPHHSLDRCTASEHKFEDANREVIESHFAAMVTAGLSQEVVDNARSGITLFVCCACMKHWLDSDHTHILPPWYQEQYGRGRKHKTRDLVALFKTWHQGDLYCEPCGLAAAERFAGNLISGRPTEDREVTVKVPKSDIKKFLQLYAKTVKVQAIKKNFHESFSYRFHVTFVTGLFKSLPARQRVAFATMTGLLGTLNIL